MDYARKRNLEGMVLLTAKLRSFEAAVTDSLAMLRNEELGQQMLAK